jgi:hypothetical protein
MNKKKKAPEPKKARGKAAKNKTPNEVYAKGKQMK